MPNKNKHEIYNIKLDKDTDPNKIKGLVGIGLAAGALFLAGCATNGDHAPKHEQLLVSCDINETPRISKDMSLEETPRVEGFNISCVGYDEKGKETTFSMPGVEFVNPSDPSSNDLSFTELEGNPWIDSAALKHVSFVVDIKGTADHGFSIETVSPEISGTESMEFNVPDKSYNQLGDSGEVRVDSVEVVEGPGVGVVG